MRAQDRELARLLRGLDARGAWPHTTLLLVSDHGMVGVSESIDVAKPLRRAKLGCQVRSSEGVAYVYLDAPGRASEAVRILNAIPGVVAHPSDSLPRELHMAVAGRSGHVVAFTEPPRRLSARRRGLRGAFEGDPRGAHGYRGERPEMGGIFYALGRGVPAGRRLGAVRALDVAATAAALLGIEPPRDSVGKPQLP
jgi:arylsulfatase A-like enzyme